MHNLYFVIVDKDNAEDSEEARREVDNILNNEWFVWEGYFSNAKADWFVIWWRWSACLWGEESWDHYAFLWGEDDAQVITKEILEKIKNEYWDAEVFDTIELEEFEAKDLDKSYIWQWIVIVDYHI